MKTRTLLDASLFSLSHSAESRAVWLATLHTPQHSSVLAV